MEERRKKERKGGRREEEEEKEKKNEVHYLLKKIISERQRLKTTPNSCPALPSCQQADLTIYRLSVDTNLIQADPGLEVNRGLSPHPSVGQKEVFSLCIHDWSREPNVHLDLMLLPPQNQNHDRWDSPTRTPPCPAPLLTAALTGLKVLT